MKTFEAERTFTEELSVPTFKNKIPCIYFTPKTQAKNTSVFIFIGGIGSTLPFVRILNYSFFDEHYLLSYERMKTGNNKNKATRFVMPYVDEIDNLVNYTKTKFPNKKIYLLGESWGSHLAFLYYKKYQNKIDGVYCWNMPSHVKDLRKKSIPYALWLSMKMILTIITGAQTYDNRAVDKTELVSSNPELVRMMKLTGAGTHKDNIQQIAAWWSFRPAWKWLIKHLNDDTYHFIYFQSSEDRLAKWKFLNKIKTKYPNTRHICYLEKGYHILSKEQPANQALFNVIAKDVNEHHER